MEEFDLADLCTVTEDELLYEGYCSAQYFAELELEMAEATSPGRRSRSQTPAPRRSSYPSVSHSSGTTRRPASCSRKRPRAGGHLVRHWHEEGRAAA